MEKKELKKGNGDVFFEATRPSGNSCIHVNWIGIQSIETIMMGANLLLTMLVKQPCTTILNSNKELIGPWEDGANFMGSIWASKAHQLGLKEFVHVLSPGIFGRRSFTKFETLARNYLHIESFENEAEAEQYLKS